ncbi:MAG: hypothetical protein A2506_12435 [Elusimicrobia bacterium RIFOXYD12_FULL_66_9]|nr:MAG: hypothetical protein A2506_12435 [Elusimicrobia bacterium RIFOXYD12_FULL_66_9]
MLPLHTMFLLASPLFAAPAPAQPQITTEEVRRYAEKAFKDLDAEVEGRRTEKAPDAPAPTPAPEPEPAPVAAPPPAKPEPAPVPDDSEDCGGGNLALNKPAQMSSTGYSGKPEGGVDGIKDGGYAVHSGGTDEAWWQVDLGRKCRIGRVMVYNRKGYEARANTLTIMTTSDEKPTAETKWKQLASYTDLAPFGRDGAGTPTPFGGVYNDKPWVFEPVGESARWVRIQQHVVEFMNLDEIEVFGPAPK